jgi:D-methionine transport system ATP-binding protein
VRCLNLLEYADSGEIEINGQAVVLEHGQPSVNGRKMSSREQSALRRGIGMIFQHFNLMDRLTVFDNIAYPLKHTGRSRKEIERRVWELLELVSLTDKADVFPSQLSGGQKQRVAIARALASDPRVLLCDEATSALDPKTTRAILELLRKLNRDLGVTVVVITHEMRVVEQICNRVAILDGGQVRETGPVAEVFSNPRSEAGKRLVLPEGEKIHVLPENRLVRLVFDGAAAAEPIVATLAVRQGILLNILSADTHSLAGKTYGSMVLGLPQDETEAARALLYLREIAGVTAEEVTDYVC